MTQLATAAPAERLGCSVIPIVLDPGGIERSVGKMRRIIDRRPKV